MGGTQSHYERLGVAPDATEVQIRRAYRALALELHPDRQAHPDRIAPSDPEHAAAAARAMREVNAAWAVLANPAAKARYDLERRLGTAAPSAVAMHDQAPAGDHRVIRGGLWLLVLGAVAVIFVFTAYAAGGPDPVDRHQAEVVASTARAAVVRGDCVDEFPGSFAVVACAGPHDARVVELVPIGRPCPGGTREVYLPEQRDSACLAAP